MKFFNVKTAIAAVCVVAAGFGGVKAYNAAAQSETDMLLAENVEALSQSESGFFDMFKQTVKHYVDPCYINGATMKSNQCKSSEKIKESKDGQSLKAEGKKAGSGVGGSYDKGSSQTSTNTVYDNREKHECESSFLDTCKKTDQKDCNGNKIVEDC